MKNRDYSVESTHERGDASTIQTNERSERVSFLMHRNGWIKIVQALSMVWRFYFIHIEIFSRPTHFKNWKPFQYESKNHNQIHNLGPYSVSVDNFFILLFVYTLICQRRYLNLKRNRNRINMFKIKFINGTAICRWKLAKKIGRPRF